MNTAQRLVLMRDDARALANIVANAAVVKNDAHRARSLGHIHDMLLVLTEDIETVQQELYGEKETS